MTRPKAVFNWSGGKDSCLCLTKVLQAKEYDVACLLTTVNEQHQRISMHGVRVELLERQAVSLGIPLVKVFMPEPADMKTYEAAMERALNQLTRNGIRTAVFGDIFLEDLRKYREEKLQQLGYSAVFPLWHLPTRELVREFIDDGFKAIIVCVDERYLDPSFAGRTIDENFLKDLPVGVDPCGENGEFHSFVFDGPIFRQPISFTIGERVYRQYKPAGASGRDAMNAGSGSFGFWYCDLLPL